MTTQAKFKEWLIAQDQPILNQLGIDSIISNFNENLEIIGGNDLERQVLAELQRLFLEEQEGESPVAIQYQLSSFLETFF